MLYGSSTGIVRAGLAGTRVDRRQAVAGVVRDVERAQVPGRDDVLRESADGEVLDDPERARVDHVDGVALAVRNVDERSRESGGAGQVARAVVCVDVPVRRRRTPPARRLRTTGTSVRCQHAQTRLGAAGAASAGEQDPPAERDGGEIGARRRERAGRPDPDGCGVDRDDPAGRRADGGAAATDHVGDAARARQPPRGSSGPAADRSG